jgi:plastocyanin
MRILLATLTFGLVVLAACSGDSSGIQMREQAFDPTTFNAAAGSTITFTNDSSQAHTVTSVQDELPEGAEYFASGDFSSESDAREDLAGGLIEPGETYEVTLNEPGTYHYVCLPHEGQGMTGTIVVER